MEIKLQMRPELADSVKDLTPSIIEVSILYSLLMHCCEESRVHSTAFLATSKNTAGR